MLDIKMIRANTDEVKKALSRRKESIDIDAVLALDNQRRETLYKVETLKAKQNEVSKSIPALKKEGKDVTPIFEEMKTISDEIKELDNVVRELDAQIEDRMMRIPNIPNEDVPDGDTDDDNVEIRRFSKPADFSFAPKAHWDIGENLKILDFQTAAKITGARFTLYKGMGARLERAIINFFLDTHTAKGYEEIFNERTTFISIF